MRDTRKAAMAWARPLCAALCALSLLAGCATPGNAPARLAIPQPRLAPAAMGVSLSLAQHLTIERAPAGRPVSSRSLDAQLEIDADALAMAAFALGQRVMTLRWDGRTLASDRHPLLPAEVDAVYVLRDVQWTYGPLAALQATLPPGWQLTDQGRERVLSHNGEPALVIRYPGLPGPGLARWLGRAELDNRLEGYRLTLESVDQSAQ